MSESNQGMEKSTTVRIDAVKLGDRHRRDLGDVDSLVRSIQVVGLLHPIVLTPDMELIAGARRLDAYRRMGHTEIPARIVPLREILRGELEENTVRKDFTPAEVVRSHGPSAATRRRRRRGGRERAPTNIRETFPKVQRAGHETRSVPTSASPAGRW